MIRLIVVFMVGLQALADASTPTTESIDYSAPERYLTIVATLGNRDAIQERASALKGNDDRATVRNVLKWMESHLDHDEEKAYEWRNFDNVVKERCYGGCADQGIVCGALLKAAGIPTIWVKTMDVPWIWDFKKGRTFKSWSGHVFLEIYLDHQWVLLDPGAKLFYDDYSPEMRILPGNRFAYHKGDDPKNMVMSLQWNEWKEQTRDYFTHLDPALLPVDPKSAVSLVPHVYIVGNDPYYKVLADMARRKGWSVRSTFNAEYDKLLPPTKGHVLLIETHDGEPIIPIATLETFYPGASSGLKSAEGIVQIDGTTIMFVDLARVLDSMDDGGQEEDS